MCNADDHLGWVESAKTDTNGNLFANGSALLAVAEPLRPF
jgi:hypothetical protein